jgi:DNA-binding response OmpR family regulator
MKTEKLNVMVVDDSKMVLERLRYVLQRAGHTVTLRDSSLGTVSAVLKERPDVLILDVSMPALDGNRLATLVSEVNKDVTLILHSSRDERELEQLALQSGAHGYIPKTNDMLRFLDQFHRIALGGRLQTADPVSSVMKALKGA